ncbi:MAG: type II secretion system protein [Acidobacteriota bacterium]
MKIPSAQPGFSLLETLIALAILGIALTSSVALLTQYRVWDTRVSAHQSAQHCLEGQYEGLRAGLSLPLTRGVHPLSPMCAPDLPLTNLTVEAEVEPLATAGLYAVTLRVNYRVGKKDFDRTAELRLWRP